MAVTQVRCQAIKTHKYADIHSYCARIKDFVSKKGIPLSTFTLFMAVASPPHFSGPGPKSFLMLQVIEAIVQPSSSDSAANLLRLCPRRCSLHSPTTPPPIVVLLRYHTPHRVLSFCRNRRCSLAHFNHQILALPSIESVQFLFGRCSCRPLLCLLRSSLRITKVFSHICSLNTLTRHILDGIPSLLSRRRHVLLVDLLVNSCRELAEGTLNKSALVEPRSQEDGVEAKKHPCALAECQGREEETTPQSNLKGCHEHHAAVVVFLDESTDHSGKAALRLRLLRRLASRRWLRLLEGWNKVRTGVCCNVEDRIDAEWQESQRNLSADKPDKGDHCKGQICPFPSRY